MNTDSHQKTINQFITNSLIEDLGSGDHSSQACIPAEARNRAQLLVKEDGVIAGLEMAQHIFKKLDSRAIFDMRVKDGDEVKKGDVAFFIEANSIAILSGERLSLNCMQRMSGIATYTRFLCEQINHTNCKLLDTRKTTPGMRYLEKWAVRIGGGKNHRFGLYDMIMLKDNHIDYAGGIAAALQKTRTYLAEKELMLKIEVEARNMDEVREILENGPVDRIMLDNFSPEKIREAVKLIGNKAETEASGGITEKNIVQYAETGVNFISVGALTHSVKSLDLSLKAL